MTPDFNKSSPSENFILFVVAHTSNTIIIWMGNEGWLMDMVVVKQFYRDSARGKDSKRNLSNNDYAHKKSSYLVPICISYCWRWYKHENTLNLNLSSSSAVPLYGLFTRLHDSWLFNDRRVSQKKKRKTIRKVKPNWCQYNEFQIEWTLCWIM